MRISPVALLIVTLLLAGNAWALTQAQAEAVAVKYLATLPTDGTTYDASKTVMADLDGDGKPEVVLWATLMGPTYASSQLLVFADKGNGYVAAGSADLWGNVEDLTVSQGIVQVKSKMPAPNDPRCCPSLQKSYRYSWKNGKLSELK